MTTTKYVVYTIANCPYCDSAKELLRQHGETFTDIAVDTKPDLAVSIVNKTEQKTWPQIFADGYFIGGYTELKHFITIGKERKD